MNYVLITGATSGIGFALAEEFAAHGWGLCLAASRMERLEETQARLTARCQVQMRSFCQDLAQLGGARALFEAVQAEGMPISVLVNNAGFGLVGPTEEISLDQDERMLVLNVITPVELTKLFLPELADRRGKVLNVSSTGAFQPGPYTAAYFASKAFVLSYTRAVRQEAKRKGVSISALCPGSTQTEFFLREGAKTPRGAMSAKAVARIAYRGLMKGQETIIPGWHNRLMQLAPTKVKMWAVGRMKVNSRSSV